MIRARHAAALVAALAVSAVAVPAEPASAFDAYRAARISSVETAPLGAGSVTFTYNASATEVVETPSASFIFIGCNVNAVPVAPDITVLDPKAFPYNTSQCTVGYENGDVINFYGTNGGWIRSSPGYNYELCVQGIVHYSLWTAVGPKRCARLQ